MLPLRRKAFPIVRFLALLARDAVAAQMTPAPSVETLARGLESRWAIDFAPDGRHSSASEHRIRVIDNGKLQSEPEWPSTALQRQQSGRRQGQIRRRW